jgi:hypothetical protein
MENKTSNKTEKFNINVWGIKVESSNPGTKTIVMVVVILIFIVVLAVLLKAYIVPILASLGSKKILSSAQGKISSLIQLFKGRSP